MEHTPGPWGVDDAGCVYSDALPKDSCVVAELSFGSVDWGADGRLIAAAPDLLAACRLFVALEDAEAHDADTRWKQARKGMRAAIAKAEGRDG